MRRERPASPPRLLFPVSSDWELVEQGWGAEGFLTARPASPHSPVLCRVSLSCWPRLIALNRRHLCFLKGVSCTAVRRPL